MVQNLDGRVSVADGRRWLARQPDISFVGKNLLTFSKPKYFSPSGKFYVKGSSATAPLSFLSLVCKLDEKMIMKIKWKL